MRVGLPFIDAIPRSRRKRLLIAAALAVLMVFTLTVISPHAKGDVGTVSHDATRIAWDSSEPGLGPAQVTSSDFGQQWTTTLDGQIYAQPLSVGGTLIVATENDNVYGLNPSTGAIKWSRTDIGPAWPASAITCGDLVPNIGITSTPVYDQASGYVYFTSKVNDGADVNSPSWYMHAIDPATGSERSGWPVKIQGSPSNDPSTPFKPYSQLQRAGLLVMNGVVYAGFGSHCDHDTYRGYIVGVSTSAPSISSMWATEVGASNTGSGVWHAGGGIVSDGSGRLFFATGNGVMPPAGPGTSPPGTLSESVVRLTAAAGQPLKTADFFSPSNAPTLDKGDKDFGSGGPIALPDSFGTSAHPHVMLQQGKDGRIFVLDRDNLGGRTAEGTADNVLGTVGPYQGQWGHPAAWTSDAGSYAYFVGNGGPLRAFKAGASGDTPTLAQVGTSADTFPYTSGSPVITSDGQSADSGVVWVVRSGSGSTGTGAELRAFSALPASGTLQQIFSSPIGTTSKFAVPATDGNHLFVGTREGKVISFGSPAQSILTGSGVNFGSVPVGSSTGKTLTLTATQSLTVQSVKTGAPFAAAPPALPVTLNTGDSISIPVTYTPSSAGATSGLVTVTTDAGTISFSLGGVGLSPGLAAQPAAATFYEQPVGTDSTVNVQITNTGTGDETVNSVTSASGPYTVTGMPSPGDVIPAGGSTVISVNYKPTAAGSNNTSVTVKSTNGTLNIPITGTAVAGQAHLVLTPPTLDFGSLATGTSRTLNFDITNTGNIDTTITLAKAPASDFTSSEPLAEGTLIGPGQVIHQSVTYTPSSVGQATDVYTINSDSGQGVMNETLTGVGTGTVPTPSASTWQVNGSGSFKSGGAIQLTPASAKQAGSAFYKQAVRTEGLHATFTAQLNGGTGADGLTFSMLDPKKDKTTSVGGNGGGLGFANLHGIAVVLDTHANGSVTSNNFVGVASAAGGALTFLKTAVVPTNLRTGTHDVDIKVVTGHVKVSIDGKALLDVVPAAGAIPANALVGFTGATGSLTDVHVVSKVTITTTAGAGAPLTSGTASVDFREVQVGSSTTLPVTLTNNGSQPEAVTAVKQPASPFTATLPGTGTTINAGSSITVPVTFKPADDGTVTSTFAVTTTSGTVTVPLTGTGDSGLPDLSTSTWTPLGSATLSGTTITLTKDGQIHQGGLMVNSFKVNPVGVHAAFTAQITGNHTTGADGLAFALIDGTIAKPTAAGVDGGGLGIAGIPATVVALDTYKNGSQTTYPFAAVGTTVLGTKTVTWLSTSTAVPALRTGTHNVDVRVTTAKHIVVMIDGKQVLDQAVTLPAKTMIAFSAGVGAISDTHAIINPVITYTGT